MPISSPTADNNTRFDAIIATPLPACRIGIRAHEQGINAIHFLPLQTPCHQPPSNYPGHELMTQLLSALQCYFSAAGTRFSLPLAATGTPFQHRVWQAISAIPSGETRSYGQLAQDLDSSPRAIGGACRANPLPLLVPCHRVITATGHLGGFLGQTAPQGMATGIKQWLLRHEAGALLSHAQLH